MPTLAKWLKKLTSLFEEKTPIKPDDFELEHFLLYHGLVGTSPENQREFKDVRADIRMAIDNGSSLQLAATLKLSPLWWEDRLKTIFSEIGDRERVLAVLAPDVKDGALTFDDVPLLHTNWQVRANAALALANLDAVETVEKLEQSLRDTASSARIAYCHVAAALGRLGQPSSEAVIAEYLDDADPWIKVDSAAALAQLRNGQPCQDLSGALVKALLMKHSLSDYAAIAVSKVIRPQTFLEGSDQSLAAGCRMILDILNASRQTFTDDVVVESGTHSCMEQLAKLLDKPACAVAHASLRLAEWLDTHHSYTLLSPPSQADLDKAIAFRDSQACRDLVDETLSKLSSVSAQQPLEITEMRSAIALAGTQANAGAENLLKAALTKGHPLIDEAIEALSQLQAKEAADHLTRLASDLVDLEERWEQANQMHPVSENHKESSKTYWLILKALGNMPSSTSVNFLLKASNDHSPDKRSQALESLIAATQSLGEGDTKGTIPEVTTRFSQALYDPSPEVRKVGLRGVAAFAAVGDLKKVVDLTRAREVSTQREAFDTLSELAKKGHKKDVLETVAQALKTEHDAHKRQKLRDFIDAASR